MIFDIITVNTTSRYYQHHFHNPQANNHLHGSSHPVCYAPLSPTAVWFHSKEHKSHSFFTSFLFALNSSGSGNLFWAFGFGFSFS